MKCNIVTVIFFILLMTSFVSAFDNYHQQDTALSFTVTSNNATECNLTSIDSPSGLITVNQQGTKDSQTFNFSIPASNYSEKGLYCHNIECNDGSSFMTGQECYQVNYIGNELTQGQSTIYIGLLAILILIFVGTFIGIGFLPSQNETDPEGKIMSITYAKYFRLPAFLFLYFLIIGILFLASGIARAFLVDSGFSTLLFAFFNIMLTLSPLVIIILFLWNFVKVFEDKKLRSYMERGLSMGGNL